MLFTRAQSYICTKQRTEASWAGCGQGWSPLTGMLAPTLLDLKGAEHQSTPRDDYLDRSWCRYRSAHSVGETACDRGATKMFFLQMIGSMQNGVWKNSSENINSCLRRLETVSVCCYPGRLWLCHKWKIHVPSLACCDSEPEGPTTQSGGASAVIHVAWMQPAEGTLLYFCSAATKRL